MGFADLIAALLLPLPPWVGFWIFRRKGRVGLSYGYFLGGILTLLALPWAHLTGLPLPASQLGGALFGFTLFLQSQREGVQGIRRLVVGVGGSTGFLILLLLRLRLPWHEALWLWVGALLEALLWLLFSDLAYRLAKGRQLEVRMPLVGAAALGTGALVQALLPSGVPRVPTAAALLGGLLLGLVALQQLRWLRNRGAWVEGRGEGLRLALSLLDQKPAEAAPSLALGLEAQQPMWLVDAGGRILDSNGPLSQLTGLPRHRLRGYAMDAVFQGGDTPVWEGLRGQLLQYGCASLQATQVSEDGTFHQVGLEASTFDRGMALVWISDPSPGSVRLWGGGILEAGGGEDGRRRSVNALLALNAAVRRLRAESTEAQLKSAAEQIGAAAALLDPSADPVAVRPSVEGRHALLALLPRIQTLLPSGGTLRLEAAELVLDMEADALRRIAMHLALHAMEHAPAGQMTLMLESVDLGRRTFGLLHVEEGPGKTRQVRKIFGLGWLRQAVLDVGGLLELDEDAEGGIRPRVYLPTSAPSGAPLRECPLEGRRIWVVDRDPLAREALITLVSLGGGAALAFESLRSLLRDSHGQAPPDALVLERTPRLERFQRALRAFQKDPLPTLVLGMGQPLPINPASLGLRRLGFLEKPFRPEAFLESLQALLRQPNGTGRPLL
jgi:PAS domain-containing protein